MLYQRRLDASAYVILWQVGVAGDRSLVRFSTGAAYREVLVEVLAREYDLDHEVILYKAAVLPLHEHRVQRLRLRELPAAQIDLHATLVLPPARPLEPNLQVRARLSALDRAPYERTPADSCGGNW
jgi:hypothetical protein